MCKGVAMDDEKDSAEIELSRHLNASIGAVFDALTDPDRFGRWWGPHGYGATASLDRRPGGPIEIVMRAPDGTDSPIVGTYTELSEPSHIAMALTASGPDGVPMIGAEISIDLAQDPDGTAITVWASGRALSPAGRAGVAGMREGWTESLERLEQLLEEARGSTLKMRHETA
jgi:uncharacterized protein YndB with AHSA1/START domain